MNVYVIGSLRNPEVPRIAIALRDDGHEVFDDWYAAGTTADDEWRDYEKGRGRSFQLALHGYSAQHTFKFDRLHLERADAGVLVMPAGKSAHLELGWLLGRGRRGLILLDSPERWDIMYAFADVVTDKFETIRDALHQPDPPEPPRPILVSTTVKAVARRIG